MRYFLLIFHTVVAVGLVSCREEVKEYAFVGVVSVAADNLPLEGTAVTLRGQRITGSSFNPNFQTLDTDVTDSEGRFFVTVDKALFQTLRIILEHPTHFTSVRDINPDAVPVSNAHEGDYPMEPLAWVHTRLINVNLSQRIDVTVNAESNGCAECCEQVRLIHEGEFFDTAFSCLAYSGKVVTHKGNYRNAGGNVMLIDFEGTTLAYDTLFVEITY